MAWCGAGRKKTNRKWLAVWLKVVHVPIGAYNSEPGNLDISYYPKRPTASNPASVGRVHVTLEFWAICHVSHP